MGGIFIGWHLYGVAHICHVLFVCTLKVNAHLKNVGPCIDQLLDGPAKLDEIEIHGQLIGDCN